MFHFDRGIKLTAIDLALDLRRRQPRGFISHAHADHMGRHELALTTPETGKLYQHRLGKARRVLEIPYRKPTTFGHWQLTTYPAGHTLGSAMLLADNGDQTLLYTGDYKLGPSATAEETELVSADILIMESTFGHPKYRMPPRDETLEQLFELVKKTLAAGQTPVLHAYALGKAQELTKLLTTAGFPVQQHKMIYAVSQVYEACGMPLGEYKLYQREPLAGHVVVTLPRGMKQFLLPGIENPVSMTVTGWALDESTKFRLGVDHALPLSDHADFDQLLETVRQVQPKKVYCTHGPDPGSFAGHLRDLGFDAAPLERPKQTSLF